ncbi:MULTISPECIES: Vga family ABC-F type ribosomal protection protein [unclassified Viridibacillus]|uniref:Vga family ABC-F type ribosomal protection protein n=1 Tax=unclassified Viridibacillus TaxID=2617942 RepID=UPI00096EBB01|nr:ABC-F type ribosomal protection protein [Viridibacillus sp. FSL H8-0123]OMC81001.1 ABC transporter [Viridibacillus sp. FSL H8-0123]
MMLLEANGLHYSIRDREVFNIEKLQINDHDRIGLIGKNGSGKTTLLEVLAALKEPESGHVKTYSPLELVPQLKESTSAKSGGEVTKAYIQGALAKSARLLITDEPTTHLDTHHVEWLEGELLKRGGALLIVSHDRAFLDAVCTKIWELEDGGLKEYRGNYSDYTEQKKIEKKQQEASYEKYTTKKNQLEEALVLKEKKAARAAKVPKSVSKLEASKTKPYFAKKQKKLQKTAKAIETRLEQLEKVEKVKNPVAIKMDLPNAETVKGKIIIRIEDVEGRVGERFLWQKSSFQIRGGDKIAITGNNGSGKTTLLKKIVEHEKGITISPAVKVGYFSQNLNVLNVEKTILENVRELSIQDETFIRTVLARLHFYRDDVYKKVGVLSGGERVKVALAKIFVSDVNTLILDEPTNFLDIDAVEAFESLLKEYEGTIIFVSHDRRFVENIATRQLKIEKGKLQLFEGTLKERVQTKKKKAPDNKENELLILNLKISEVLGRLSIEPTKELESEFQRLIEEKRKL